jgi:hypothetical protein
MEYVQYTYITFILRHYILQLKDYLYQYTWSESRSIIFKSHCDFIYTYIYIVTCRPVAGQRLSKYFPAETDSG